MIIIINSVLLKSILVHKLSKHKKNIRQFKKLNNENYNKIILVVFNT